MQTDGTQQEYWSGLPLASPYSGLMFLKTSQFHLYIVIYFDWEPREINSL